MACACKNAKKISNLIPNNNSKSYEKKGILYFLNKIYDIILEIINKLIVIATFIILTPIIILILIWNYLFKGELILGVPKYIYNKIMNHNNG